MVVGGVRARVPRPKGSGDGFAGPAWPVVDEGHQRVVAVGLLLGRGGILLVGVGDDQDSVQVHDHLPTGVRCLAAGQRPGAGPDFVPGGADGVQCLLVRGGEGVDQAGDRGVGGDRSEHGRLGPQHGDVGEAAPAKRDRQRKIYEYLPGSWMACGFRQGASAADMARSRPALRTVSTSSTEPACETTARPSSRTRTWG